MPDQTSEGYGVAHVRRVDGGTRNDDVSVRALCFSKSKELGSVAMTDHGPVDLNQLSKKPLRPIRRP